MNGHASAPGPGRLRPYALPHIERTTLANGLTLLHARHGDASLVNVLVLVDAGTIREAPARAGLATLMANTLDTGANGRSGDDLAWQLERLGVELEAEASWDASWVTATVATEHFAAALALLADVVRRPSFPEKELERLRDEQLADIMQRRADPRALASDQILHFLYGDEAAYGRPANGLPERVRSLGRGDVAGFHAAHVVPACSSVVIVGDIDAADAAAAVTASFGDWTARGEHGPVPARLDGPDRVELHLVDRPGSVQSEIRAAHAGVARDHPDYFALRVLNTILGGAFTSRLNLSLREKHGFTYGVRSGFAFRRAPGPFTIQTAVATEVTARAVEEMLREIILLRDGGATAAEVENARDYLAGLLPLEMQTVQQVAARFADLVLYDLPDDYFHGYRDAIRAVTGEEVLRVARTHLHPERLTFCIVGDASQVRAPLEALGRGAVLVHRVPD
jgi:predicted Zn-dependent peptidase